jgi:hypothetical protein
MEKLNKEGGREAHILFKKKEKRALLFCMASIPLVQGS